MNFFFKNVFPIIGSPDSNGEHKKNDKFIYFTCMLIKYRAGQNT